MSRKSELSQGLMDPVSPRNPTEACSTSLVLTTAQPLEHPTSPASSIWNPTPSPVTDLSTSTHFLWPRPSHSNSLHEFPASKVLDDDLVLGFLRNRFDLPWGETTRQWEKKYGIVPTELQDQTFRENVESACIDNQEVGTKQEWCLMWKNNASYWTRSQVIARWREESIQQRILSWKKSGQYHTQTLELWERITVDARAEEHIDEYLGVESQMNNVSGLDVGCEYSPSLQPQPDFNPPRQKAGASPQIFNSDAFLQRVCDYGRFSIASPPGTPIRLSQQGFYRSGFSDRPSEANSGRLSDAGSHVSSAASIKDALPHINSTESFLGGSNRRLKRRYSSLALESNSSAKRSRIERPSFDYSSIPQSPSPRLSAGRLLTLWGSYTCDAYPNEKAGLEGKIEAMVVNEDNGAPEEGNANKVHMSAGPGRQMDNASFFENAEQAISNYIGHTSKVIRERSHSPCGSALSSLSRISDLEFEHAENHWPGPFTEQQLCPSPQLEPIEQEISYGDQSPSEPISRSMLATEVVSRLVEHGCQDVTDAVDTATFGDHPISHGGFSDVYCGRLLSGTQVAIKALRISASDITQNPKHLKASLHAARELHTWSKCTHPNVLQLLGLAVFRGRIGMVSPWMSQGNLPRYLELTPGVNRRSLCIQISNGLSYLHEIGIIHGDLKGANVLISDDGAPVLTDFGNSLLIDRSMKFTETTSSSSLTVRWSVAEIINEGLPTEASDVYALAMVIYEVMAGTLPYNGKREAVIINLVVVKKEPPGRPGSIPIGCEGGDKLWDVLVRCWSFEPAARPSASEVARTIGQCRLVGRAPHSGTSKQIIHSFLPDFQPM
ncbi:Tyrosine-protein kinase receptor torso [Rhizoctonia solani]|uniref:Tyrosine-protein kinase receptor torso n=1 Tax=Rhizoctonia solani TaxID=456999 RepID=A0A0K6G728_9AGAM|nr:Tyrosine-protein kinase receptor torso [Rhizoctonia solani]